MFVRHKLKQPIQWLHLSTALREARPGALTAKRFRLAASTFHSSISAHHNQVIFQICQKEHEAMARFNQSEFASISLSQSDEKHFQAWVEAEGSEPLAMLTGLLSDGFKVSVSWVISQNSFCFSIIGTENTRNHTGLVMTSWSDDLAEVIAIGCYKHYVMCEGNTWPTRDNNKRWG